jgi:MFS family permease
VGDGPDDPSTGAPSAEEPAGPIDPVDPVGPATAIDPESSVPAAAQVAAPDAAKQGSGSWPMWLLGLVVLTDQIDTAILRGVLSTLEVEFELSELQLGLLASCFILVNGLVTVPAGYLADRWSRVRTVGNTMIVWSGITALTAASQSYAHLIATRSALGFGQAITEPATNSLLADYYKIDERGRAYSIQQVLGIVGGAIGLGLGGFVAAQLSWRWAFLLVGSPSIVVAFMVFRLKEPRRGASDRAHVGAVEDDDEPEPVLRAPRVGLRRFTADFVRGLGADMRTIMQIRTMRYALVGVTVLLFVVTAIGVWLPFFYERQLGVETGSGAALVGLLMVLGGVPGILLGGKMADRYVNRIVGGRVAVPAVCIATGNCFFLASWHPSLTVVPVFTLQLIGIFAITTALPALRAGLSDAVPANLRGAGFGAFNLASVLGGQAAAPLVLSLLAANLDGNLRTSFFIMSFPTFFGAWVLYRARGHLEADTQKIFAAVLTAMAEQQARDEAAAAEAAAASAPGHDDDGGAGGPDHGGPDPGVPPTNGSTPHGSDADRPPVGVVDEPDDQR